MSELPEAIYDQITQLSEEGDELVEQEQYAQGLQKYEEAWQLLPEPREQWDAALWLLAAMGDANFMADDFAAARDNLSQAMVCAEAVGNPFIHLRLGQCQFELGNQQQAADELARAYMSEGYEIFEDQDPKYFAFLKTRLDPPEGGWEDE